MSLVPFCSSLPSAVAPSFSLLFLFAYHHSSPHQTSLTPGAKGMGLIEHKRDRVVIGGLAVVILVLIAMVVVVVVFVSGNGAQENAGLFSLDGDKHPMSNLLCLLLLWDLFLDLLVGASFLVNFMGCGVKGLFSSFFSSSNTSIFFMSNGKGFIHLL